MEFQTLFNADCLDSCSVHRGRRDHHGDLTLLACGGYELVKQPEDSSPGRRMGGIHLLYVNAHHRSDGCRLCALPFVDLSCGVLDVLCVLSSEGSVTLVAAGADAAVHIIRATLEWGDEEGLSVSSAVTLSSIPPGGPLPPPRPFTLASPTARPELTAESTCGAPGGDGPICTSVALLDDSPCVFGYCVSDGTACLVQSEDLTQPRRVATWCAHDLETWTIALQPTPAAPDQLHGACRLIATGADDCVMKIWDARVGFDAPVAHNRREHPMGVTAIAFHDTDEHTLLSGCYDEHVRVWDLRSIGSPTSSFKSSGGVWRIKWDSTLRRSSPGQGPSVDRLMVAACHGGCQIWQTQPTATGEYELLHEYTGHGSMAYGIASVPSAAPGAHYYASCSFYDRKLALWRVG
ncbi:unnamed protein product [Vitrella brassicaformis CCMP3155]|uniref:methylated diphthine methylhydrolase n=1 Tax=Vitrella brassicaformis (strain CCMP3155) TaxID=1169540 RepID=A0A0G4FB26_VITBC|nr:unnamed protein product [Vitrella brassicaformis CCMP3155]|eukprot:CEM10109.1 unnamed protein product [Vitrella brassicaformis CCMP3155]